jgi:hypothetical protein
MTILMTRCGHTATKRKQDNSPLILSNDWIKNMTTS